MAMKRIDLTILAYEGPIYRAYLSVLSALGYKAKRLIKLYNGKNKLRWLPSCLRNPLLYNKEALSNNYWPNHFLRKKALSENITKTITEAYNLPRSFFDLLGKGNFDTNNIAETCIYCDCQNEGLKSENLFQLLQSLGPQTYLFTGGGLVPKRILELPKTQFVHVHPGFLPYVRGADGLLWSTLIRKRPGAACFYMVPQLDEGHLIITEELPALQFNLPESVFELQTLYRMAYSFYDPAIRAVVLKDVLEKFNDLADLPTTEQDLTKGITYHFMHNELKQKVLRQIFI